jgi:hypothetical protein
MARPSASLEANLAVLFAELLCCSLLLFDCICLPCTMVFEFELA